MDAWPSLRSRIHTLAEAYRDYGHLAADLDPLGLTPRHWDDLALERFGLADVDPDTMVTVSPWGLDPVAVEAPPAPHCADAEPVSPPAARRPAMAPAPARVRPPAFASHELR